MAKQKDPGKAKGKAGKKVKKSRKQSGLLDDATQSLKTFRKSTRSLTTGQKVVGGIALLAAGLTYLAKKRAGQATPASPDAQAAEAHLATLGEAPASEPESTAEEENTAAKKAPAAAPAPRRKSRRTH